MCIHYVIYSICFIARFQATKELQSLLLFATRPAAGAPATPRELGNSNAILGLEAAEELGLRKASTAAPPAISGLGLGASSSASFAALSGLYAITTTIHR